MRSAVIALGLGLAGLVSSVGLGAGCSNYDPDLGPTPFKCVVDNPECPDDYSCQADTDGNGVCVAAGGVVPTPDSNPGFQCANDGLLEPNETVAMAYNTDVGTAPSRQFGPLSICPAGDKDTYRVQMPTGTMKALEVKVSWDGGPALTGNVLNAGGTVIKMATDAGANMIRACAVLPAGMFYAQVAGGTDVQNNYRIVLSIIDNCAMP